MKKPILVIAALVLMTLAGNAPAQTTEKKDTEKKEPTTTTLDAWREALPVNEQSSGVSPTAVSEPNNNAELEESAAEIENRVVGLEEKLLQSLKQRDLAMLKQLLANDFMPAGMNLIGPQAGKNHYIERAAKNSELKSYDIEKVSVRVFDNTAVATVQYKRTPNAAGATAASGDFIATGIWVKRDNQWQAVSHHVSQSPKP